MGGFGFSLTPLGSVALLPVADPLSFPTNPLPGTGPSSLEGGSGKSPGWRMFLGGSLSPPLQAACRFASMGPEEGLQPFPERCWRIGLTQSC